MTPRAFRRVSLLVLFLMFPTAPMIAGPGVALRIIQTSSAGKTVCVIDPNTNKVVGIVHGIEVNRAVAASLDGSHLFVTNQSVGELAVVDAKTFQIVKHIPLDGRPDYVSIGKDGRHLYIGLDTNAVEVIDVASLEKVKDIPVKGAVHYAYVTPDGKYVRDGVSRRQEHHSHQCANGDH